MKYEYSKFFRTLDKFTVTNIYSPYRYGGIKAGGKFIGRTFRLKDGVLEEKIWVDRKPEWKTAQGKVIVYDKVSEESVEIDLKDAIGDRRFWSTYKKVFDVALKTDDGDVTINGLGAFKIQEMLKADFDIVDKIPMNGDKEKFDWEDGMYKELVGREFRMKVTGAGLDTKYNISFLGKSTDIATAADLGDGFVSDDTENLPF